MMVSRLALTLILVLGCRRDSDPRTAPVADKASAKQPPDRIPVEELEAAAQAAEAAHPEGLPPCGPSVKGPCAMKTTSQIGHVAGDKLASESDVLPPAKHGHGEALRGAWVAADGTEFLVGYMYTGAPGPDTGVVYRRDPKGAWRIVYTKAENELGHIWGSSADDVWVAGVSTVAHWDGHEWREESIPGLQGSVTGVWGNGSELYVVGGEWRASSNKGRIYRRDATGTWTLDGKAAHMLYGVEGVGSTVFAVGDEGQILRRAKAGSWIDEGSPGGQNTQLYVASDHDIYVAGSQLVHSTGDGAWAAVAFPSKAQVVAVWGRSATDVYVGTLSGLFHGDGKTWRATEWKHGVEALAGNADEVLVGNQAM